MPDLSVLDSIEGSNQGAEIELIHPLTMEIFEPSIKIWVYGVDSAQFQKAQQAATNRRLKTMGRRKSNALGVTAEELEDESLIALAKCIFQWENVEWEEESLECTYKNVKMALERLPWMREQLDAFMSDRANFLQKSRSEFETGVNGDSASSTMQTETS